MSGIGYECKCGEVFEEGTNFKWEFKCSCGGGASHTEECEGRDWQAKETAFKAIVFKHVENCSKATRCLKCSKPFGYGLEFTRITGSERAGTYHEECWAEVEKEEENQEGNNPNSNFTCQECKKPIKAEEKCYKQTIPDSFQSYDVYYHKSCWEQKQGTQRPLPGSGEWVSNNTCSECGSLAVGGYCQICAHKRHNNNSNDDNQERERERERAKSEQFI